MQLVGVLNVTPDSFFDGGRHPDPIARGVAMVEAGADWLDVGGESTRPGAPPVSEEEECARVLPVIEALAGTVPISIDTSKPGVARRALLAGAEILNDVTGLSNPEMVALTADARGAVIMHSRGTPQTMARQTSYEDLITEICDALVERAASARCSEVWIDPGIGFAKTAQQSLSLLRHIPVFASTGFPVFIGASRKSFLGHTLGLPNADDRLAGSLAAAAAAYHRGADAVRVHDVIATRQLLDVLQAIDNAP